MIKTLRITSIFVVISAVVFLVFPAVFGSRGDNDIELFLKSPGAIEQFNIAKVDRDKEKQDQMSPLVKQAQDFALYLNPPPKPTPQLPSPQVDVPRMPPKVTPKFRLIGTSYYDLRPEQSLALIDEPGKGFRWVEQSEEVGHLVFEQIKDGVVVLKDGQKTFEITADRPAKKSLVKNLLGNTTSEPPSLTLETLVRSETSEANTVAAGNEPPASPPLPVVDEKTAALMEEFMSRMKDMQSKAETNEADKERRVEGNAEMMEKFISDLQAMRISSEESKELGDLGEELKSVQQQQEPNQFQTGKLKDRSKIMERRSRERIVRERRAKEAKGTEPNAPMQEDEGQKDKQQ